MNKFQEIIDSLECIFSLAIETGNLSVALRAKEMIAKHYGFFDKTKSPSDIKEASAEDLQQLLWQLRVDAQDVFCLPERNGE